MDTGPVQSPHELIHIPGTRLELPGLLHIILPRCTGDCPQAGGDGLMAEHTEFATPLILSS